MVQQLCPVILLYMTVLLRCICRCLLSAGKDSTKDCNNDKE